jgi:hypothetical protein
MAEVLILLVVVGVVVGCVWVAGACSRLAESKGHSGIVAAALCILVGPWVYLIYYLLLSDRTNPTDLDRGA